MTHLISDVDISPRSIADDGVSAVRCPIWRGELIAIGRCVSLQGERAECVGCPHARKARAALKAATRPTLERHEPHVRRDRCIVCRGTMPPGPPHAKACSQKCKKIRRRILQKQSWERAR